MERRGAVKAHDFLKGLSLDRSAQTALMLGCAASGGATHLGTLRPYDTDMNIKLLTLQDMFDPLF